VLPLSPPVFLCSPIQIEDTGTRLDVIPRIKSIDRHQQEFTPKMGCPNGVRPTVVGPPNMSEAQQLFKWRGYSLEVKRGSGRNAGAAVNGMQRTASIYLA
jgi:hypothetical protein